MRHELLIIVAALLIVIVELFNSDEHKERVVPFAIVIFLAVTVMGFLPIDTGTLFGGMYRTDDITIMMKNALNIGVFIIFLQSAAWLKKHRTTFRSYGAFYFIMLASLSGMQYLISSGDFLMFFIGTELATIPIAALVAMEKAREKSGEAGVKLILSAALSSGITLFGISLLYGTSGSIYFPDVTKAFNGSDLQVLALVFVFTGIAFKISIVPFHLWTADVYEGAPVNITSYLSVISKGAAIFILIFLLFKVFYSVPEIWKNVLYATSVLTMTIGNLFAIRQQNLKRFLAFSSIAQAGFVLLGIISGTQLGFASVVYFLLIYVFSNLGAFGVVAAISNATGKENLDDYNGLYRTNPKMSLVMMLSLFSLAGIPPVAGFFGKFFLFMAAAREGYYILLLIAVANMTISLYYYLLVVKAMFINESDDPVKTIDNDFYTKAGLAICAAGIIVIGFFGTFFDYINSMAFGPK
jgi:NADH-quinone oxidoreductase subunit N